MKSAVLLHSLLSLACLVSVHLQPTPAHFVLGALRYNTSAHSRQTVKASASAYRTHDGMLLIKQGLNSSSAAFGVYDETNVTVSGWATLNLKLGDSFNRSKAYFLEESYFALGYLEGYLTCQRIFEYYQNFFKSSFDGAPSAELDRFMRENLAWVKEMSLQNKATSDYWAATSNVIRQFEGLVDGYNAAIAKSQAHHSSKNPSSSQETSLPMCRGTPLTELQFFYLNADGDLFDLVTKFGQPSRTSTFSRSTGVNGTNQKLLRPTHFRYSRRIDSSRNFENIGSNKTAIHPTLRCSSLIRITEDDVLFSHATWDTYATMAPRMYKTYQVGILRSGGLIQHAVTFSSSPGFLASIDDWYIIKYSSDLVVIETTNDVYNHSIYDALTPKSVLCWLRSVVANQLATTAKEWTSLFSTHASGTYTNQWMIIDLNVFSKRSGLASPTTSLFWVLEEMPGLIVAQDQTEHLKKNGYWASYNVPFFNRIYEYSGTAQMFQKFGDEYSHENCPRARMFRELWKGASSLIGMQRAINYNKWQTDPFSLGEAKNAIAARYDLDVASPEAVGALDGKVGSFKSVKGDVERVNTKLGTTYARVGATHDDQPIFCWKDPFLATPHNGHPSCFNFSWQALSPQELTTI